MRTLRAFITLSAALSVGAASAGAQSFTATGSNVDGAGNDLTWSVSCVEVNGVWGNSGCSSTPTFAKLVTATPGGWTSTPTNGASYISVLPSGSIGGSNGEDARYQYTFSTTFSLGALNPGSSTLVLDTFWFDNYWVGYRLNGGDLVSGGIDPEPLPPNGENWTRPYTLTIGGLQAGDNTLELVIQGNGATDGILAAGTITATPEPGTVLLLGTGLVGVAFVGRRRRQRAE